MTIGERSVVWAEPTLERPSESSIEGRLLAACGQSVFSSPFFRATSPEPVSRCHRLFWALRWSARHGHLTLRSRHPRPSYWNRWLCTIACLITPRQQDRVPVL